MLFDAVMIVQAGLRSPADVERRVYVSLGPLHDLAELIPVLHFLELEMLYRSSRYDHAVIVIALDLIKSLIERKHVLFSGHV